MTKEPTGFGKAKLGMSVAEVKKLYPKMEPLAEGQNLGSPPVGGPYITRYVLREAKVGGLSKPADVELRFWKDKFWLYIVYFGAENAEAVFNALKKEHGAPTGGADGPYPTWVGEKSAVVMERQQGRYTINDNGLSKEAQAWFIDLLKQRMGSQVQVKEPSPPGGTPAGGSPGAPAGVTPAATGATAHTPAAGEGH